MFQKALKLIAAEKAPLSSIQLSPELPHLVDKAPEGKGWLHEMKYDGYRILSILKNGRIQLKSRNGLDWTDRFPEIVQELKRIKISSAVLDGEVVVLNEKGVSTFSQLQKNLSFEIGKGYTYFVFDLIYLEGHDLRSAPLLARKEILKNLILKKISHRSTKSLVIRFSSHMIDHGQKIYQASCKRQIEGVISKRVDSTYESGRSKQWVKTKCRHEEEFVIGGFTDPGGSRQGFGALLLGYFKGSEFIYAGRVGSGFDTESLRDIYRKLRKIEISEPAFSTSLIGPEKHGAHYVCPIYVAQIQFTEWGGNQRLRHPVFLGLREDKSAADVTQAA